MADIYKPGLPPTPILDSITNSDDIEKLAPDELDTLADEMRQEITKIICHTDQLMPSASGPVELLVGLHYALNSPRGKVMCGGNPQAYAHKILTGEQPTATASDPGGNFSEFPQKLGNDHDDSSAQHPSNSVEAILKRPGTQDLQDEDSRVFANGMTVKTDD